jgi:hypothetical protein
MIVRSKVNLIAALSLVMVVSLTAKQGFTQTQPSRTPAATTAAVSLSQTEQAKEAKEWLTAYMMVHHGYRLNHMDALEDKFNKMTPTQLETLKMMYEQKHTANLRRDTMFQQAQDQVNNIRMSQVRGQQQMFNKAELQGEQESAAIEQNRLNQMHREAAANIRTKEAHPLYGGGGYYGGYGGYGPYRYPY